MADPSEQLDDLVCGTCGVELDREDVDNFNGECTGISYDCPYCGESYTQFSSDINTTEDIVYERSELFDL